MKTYSIIVSGTVQAENRDEAERAMLALCPWDVDHIGTPDAELRTAVVIADDGRSAEYVNGMTVANLRPAID